MKTELVALLLVLLAIVAVPAAVLTYDSAHHAANTGLNEIWLVGHTPLNGNWSQREIHLKQGVPVRVHLTSEDVTHGFYVPDFNVNAGSISPGKFKTVEFTPDRAGTFNFYCNILCSHEHGGMVGKLIVE